MPTHSPSTDRPPDRGLKLARIDLAGERPLHGHAVLLDVVERIEQIVDNETDALRRFKAIDLREFNTRKSQGLLELTRAVRALGGAGLDPRSSARLKLLRAKLETNQTVLATHLRAAKEITSMVAETIRDSESDGTYSNVMPLRGASPW